MFTRAAIWMRLDPRYIAVFLWSALKVKWTISYAYFDMMCSFWDLLYVYYQPGNNQTREELRDWYTEGMGYKTGGG